MKGFGKIFSFTFVEHVKQKGYRNVTIIMALLCLLLPAVIMPAVEYFKEDEAYVSKLAKIYVVEMGHGKELKADFEILNSVDPNRFTDIEYEAAADVEEASKKAEEEDHSALLVVDGQEGGYQIDVLLPEETKLNKKDVNAYGTFVSDYFRYILVQKSELEDTQITELTMPIETKIRDSAVPLNCLYSNSLMRREETLWEHCFRI